MLLLEALVREEAAVAAILMLLNRMLDVAIPPNGGPQKDIDARFASIVEGYYKTA